MKRLIFIFVLFGLLLPTAYGDFLKLTMTWETPVCLRDAENFRGYCPQKDLRLADVDEYGFYEGEVSNGVPNGQGTFWFVFGNCDRPPCHGHHYEGEFKDGKAHGEGVYYLGPTETIHRSGTWRNGRHWNGVIANEYRNWGTMVNGVPCKGCKLQEIAAQETPKQVATPKPEPKPKPKPKPEPPPVKLVGTGTGFVVNDDYAVTADHVIDDCSEVSIRHAHKEYDVTIVARDATNDLGLLRLDTPLKHHATLRGGKPLRLGDEVANYGYPLFGELSDHAKITRGDANSLAGIDNDSRVIQYDAPTQPGNSGGPVLDQSAHVVGVVSSGLSKKYAEQSGHIAQNVNFAIKSYLVEGFLSSNGVKFKKAPSTEKLELPDIAERAEKFTVLVGCWK